MTEKADKPGPSKRQQLIVSGVSYFLCVVFVLSGFYKLFAWNAAVEQFEQFGYAPWFVIVTVLVEIMAAVLVAWPLTRYWGATLIVITMIAAMFSQLKADDPVGMLAPFIFFLLANVVTWYGPLKRPDQESEASTGEPAKTSS